MYKILLITLLLINQICLAEESTEEVFHNGKKNAIIQVLNKITAKAQYLDVPVKSSVKIGTLTITVNACWKASPYDLTENKLLLNIKEKKSEHQDLETIFDGWMFSSSPGISTLEHAVYDITAVNCYDLKGK